MEHNEEIKLPENFNIDTMESRLNEMDLYAQDPYYKNDTEWDRLCRTFSLAYSNYLNDPERYNVSACVQEGFDRDYATIKNRVNETMDRLLETKAVNRKWFLALLKKLDPLQRNGAELYDSVIKPAIKRHKDKAAGR